MAHKAGSRLLSLLLGCAMVAGCTAPTTGAAESSLTSQVQASLDLAEHYFTTTAFREKGLFRYRYDPIDDRYTQRNNELRQLMGSRLLAEMAAGDPDLLEKHRTNIGFVLRYWYVEVDDIGFIFYDDKSKLGASAMALRALVYSPDFRRLRQDAERLANGILALRNADGSFRPWLKEPDYPYDSDYLMTFYSGEAILAMVEYANKTDDSELLELMRGSQDFYLDKYVTHLEENYYPAYVPWHTQSLSLLFELTGDRRYADAVFTLNDELLKQLDRTEHKGRFYNPATPQYGTPHASSDAVYTEGLAYALETAKDVGSDDHVARYTDAVELALRHLIGLQYTEANSDHLPQPARALGGFRTSNTDARIRIDNVQHTIDAYMKALSVLPE